MVILCYNVVKLNFGGFIMEKNINLIIRNKTFRELNPIIVGYEKCEKLHSYGPAIREYWLIHYVISGTGTVEKGDKIYNVSPGQAFIIFPGEICTYTADKENPWEYIWIGFTGCLAEKFSTLDDVVEINGALFSDLLEAREYNNCMEEFLTARLFMIYAELFSETHKKSDYVEKVTDYINAQYDSEISVGGIAEMIGIDRTYLSKLFKKEKNISIKEYILTVRMNHATKFLKKGYSVAETAELVGYNDTFNFSRMYKKKMGHSPIEIKISARMN